MNAFVNDFRPALNILLSHQQYDTILILKSVTMQIV